MSHPVNEPINTSSPSTSLRERLLRLVRQILGASAASRPLPIDARFLDLGLSSLKMVSLLLAIEAEFNVEIPQSEITPEHFESIASVEQMLARVCPRLTPPS